MTKIVLKYFIYYNIDLFKKIFYHYWTTLFLYSHCGFSFWQTNYITDPWSKTWLDLSMTRSDPRHDQIQDMTRSMTLLSLGRPSSNHLSSGRELRCSPSDDLVKVDPNLLHLDKILLWVTGPLVQHPATTRCHSPEDVCFLKASGFNHYKFKILNWNVELEIKWEQRKIKEMWCNTGEERDKIWDIKS